MNALEETIAAVSSPFGEGAVALLRLSGPAALAIAGACFRRDGASDGGASVGAEAVAALAPRRAALGVLHDTAGVKVDEVLLTVFRAPASYTGEDVVEIACHGGILVTRRVLETLLRAGARAAHPGEFTQRAFLNGKMDLTQAEAVMDLISAQTELALRAAGEQLEGRLGRRIGELLEQTLELLAHVEAYIDFPDEDIDPETGSALQTRLESLRSAMGDLLATAARGRILREGVRTVIAGAPNVGKSSLLNVLLGYDRAIVSATPGTTRDSIEEVINVRGIPLRLIDTAGLRESEDAIERAGIERSRKEIARADLVLRVDDASRVREAEEPAPDAARELLVLNKIDQGEDAGWRDIEAVRISCRAGTGLAELEGAIEARVFGGGTAHRQWSVAINARHQACLERAVAALERAREALAGDVSAEFVAEELRDMLGALGEIVGKVDTEDLLGKIFSTFCIGK